MPPIITGKTSKPLKNQPKKPDFLAAYRAGEWLGVQDTIYYALRAQGVGSAIAASTSNKIAGSELSWSKLIRLINGGLKYPVLDRTFMIIPGSDWSLSFSPVERPVTKKDEHGNVMVDKRGKELYVRDAAKKVMYAPVFDENGDPVLAPVINFRVGIDNLPLRLTCERFHGKGARSRNVILNHLAAMGASVGDVNTDQKKTRRKKPLDADEVAAIIKTGWHRGAITIRRVCERAGAKTSWQAIIAYHSPRPDKNTETDAVVAVHRGIANFLTVAVLYPNRDKPWFPHAFSGDGIVRSKVMFGAERDRARRRGGGVGRRARNRLMAKVGDKERRLSSLHCWRAAAWLQRIIEEVNPKLVILDDFSTPIVSDSGESLPGMITRFPFAQLKLKVIDAITRRAGVEVIEVPSKYVSVQCPVCNNTDQGNIHKRAGVRCIPHLERDDRNAGTFVESGEFHCTMCHTVGDLDRIAALNLLIRVGDPDGKLRKGLWRYYEQINRVKEAEKKKKVG